MPISALSAHKKKLRHHYRKKRQQLSSAKQIIYSIRLCREVTKLLNGLDEENILRLSVFLAHDGEIDLSRLSKRLSKLGHHLYVPVVQGLHQPLRFSRKPVSPLLLQNGQFDIPIPKNRRQVQAKLMDVMFIPLVAFDSFKNRLGMGGGFYDRTLAEVQHISYQLPLTIGMAHDCQFSQQRLPIETTDTALHMVITPSRYY